MVSTRLSLDSTGGEGYSAVDLGETVRISLMLVPRRRGSFGEQAQEVFSAQRQMLQRHKHTMAVTSQTVFLRDPALLPECERLLSRHYGARLPATNFVFQPPCCGAALAVEAWAIGGRNVEVECCGPHATAVTYDGVRWIYCAGIRSTRPDQGVYQQTTDVLRGMSAALGAARCGFQRVVRTWFYLDNILAWYDGFNAVRVTLTSQAIRASGLVALTVSIDEGPRQIVADVAIEGARRRCRTKSAISNFSNRCCNRMEG
jgi:enamine deaminase RidA (YjgF/YER057c/UK114 family)